MDICTSKSSQRYGLQRAENQTIKKNEKGTKQNLCSELFLPIKMTCVPPTFRRNSTEIDIQDGIRLSIVCWDADLPFKEGNIHYIISKAQME
jgi:hypothetical protein